MRAMRCLLVLLVAASATSAHADQPFPGGAYGQADGCRYARTGESSSAEDFLLIDREAITTAVAVCEIRSAAITRPGEAALVLLCNSEGESGGEEAATASLRNGAWTVRLADGTVFDPAKRCP